MKNTQLKKCFQAIGIGTSLLLLFAINSCTKEDVLDSSESGAAISAINTSNLNLQETSQACMTRCLVAGQNKYVGSVDVGMSTAGDVLVTYNVTKPNLYLLEINVDIFTDINQLKNQKKLSSGGAIPGKFAFKKTWTAKDKVTKYTVTIPKSYVDQVRGSSNCINIATHAALSNKETAWGGLCTDSPKGVTLDGAKKFPGKNWSVYFEFCLDECKKVIDFTYAWEDKRNEGNDADYNDLVIQSDVIKGVGELKITFLATARGASYDHKFKFRIPKAGIVDVFGANGVKPTVTTDGSDYIITVFESTKAAIPSKGSSGFANTVPTEPCTPFAYREIVLTTNSSFSFNASKPYIPFISVYNSGSVNTGPFYDLSIFALSGKDTWKSPDGGTYPNGILIPRDWKWPIEKQHIHGPYPKFDQKDWELYLAQPSLTFSKCQ